MSDVWYYVDSGQQSGPVSYKELRAHLISSQGINVFVWRRGFSDWMPARDVAELASVFEGPPPIPSRAVRTFGGAPREANLVNAFSAEDSLSKRLLPILGWIVGAVIGIAAAKFFGASFMWPAGLIAVAWLILAKCRVETRAIPMLAIVIGHTGWIIVGMITLYLVGRFRSEQLAFLVDVTLVTMLSIWFFRARSRAAVIGILIYQVCALGFGVMGMSEVKVPGLNSNTLMLAQTMHIILRLLGIAMCIYAAVNLRKPSARTDAGAVFE